MTPRLAPQGCGEREGRENGFARSFLRLFVLLVAFIWPTVICTQLLYTAYLGSHPFAATFTWWARAAVVAIPILLLASFIGAVCLPVAARSPQERRTVSFFAYFILGVRARACLLIAKPRCLLETLRQLARIRAGMPASSLRLAYALAFFGDVSTALTLNKGTAALGVFLSKNIEEAHELLSQQLPSSETLGPMKALDFLKSDLARARQSDPRLYAEKLRTSRRLLLVPSAQELNPRYQKLELPQKLSSGLPVGRCVRALRLSAAMKASTASLLRDLPAIAVLSIYFFADD